MLAEIGCAGKERPANSLSSGKASPPPPIHVVDTFAGAHLGTLGQLSSSLFGAKLKSRVMVYKGRLSRLVVGRVLRQVCQSNIK